MLETSSSMGDMSSLLWEESFSMLQTPKKDTLLIQPIG